MALARLRAKSDKAGPQPEAINLIMRDTYRMGLARLTWRDWKTILFRVKDEMAQDNVSLVAAGVAFYAMLALFPGIAAFVGAYGLVADPADVPRHLGAIDGLLPEEAFAIIEGQVTDLAAAGPSDLGFASIVAILLAVWSARSGINALVRGLNIVYDEVDQRGFFAQAAVTLTLTAVMLVVVAIAFLAILAVPAILNIFDFGAIGEWFTAIVRWPIVIGAVIAALAILYRFGPNRKQAELAWMSWGAALATLLWIAGSAGFSIYVANFASYNETYGSLGAVVGLLMWFYLSAFIILVGAEINAEVERFLRTDPSPAAAAGDGSSLA